MGPAASGCLLPRLRSSFGSVHNKDLPLPLASRIGIDLRQHLDSDASTLRSRHHLSGAAIICSKDFGCPRNEMSDCAPAIITSLALLMILKCFEIGKDVARSILSNEAGVT